MSKTFEDLFRKRFGRPPTEDEMGAFIDESVTSHNQSGGITARTVNIGPQPRVFDDVFRQQILAQVPKTNPITVAAVMGDGEALSLAREIFAFLEAEGYPLQDTGVSQEVYSGPVEGVVLQGSKFVVGRNMG